MSSPAALHDLTALDLVAGYRRRDISPVEVMDDVIARIGAWNPHINALYAFEPDAARAAARQSEARWRRGEPPGPLDGVPVTLKENIATKGVPMPLGSAATELVPQQADAPPAARLREAGAIAYTKTTMPEYGMLSSGLSLFHGLTRNPWDLSKNTGGSSAGAGAACAAGFGPLHLGSDIGGSVRLPANWCGIFALKPSNGRVPVDPPYFGRCAGPLTRTVADAALMMGVLSRPDWRDHMSLPPDALDWTALDGEVKGKRMGLMLDAGSGLPLDAEIRPVIIDAARAFAAAGAVVSEVGPVMDQDLLDGLDRFWRVRSWDDVRKLPPERRARLLPYIRAWAESGAACSALDVMHGYNGTMTIRAQAAQAFAELDYIVSPVAPVVSFPAEFASPTNDPGLPLQHIGFTVPWNMAENPAASINAGYSAAGFPIGLQIVGRRFDDIGVLRMARAFETMRGPQRPWPQPPA
ncbi:amidase [Chelatococcus reniformis]|uniref:Amidase n=1 Tax=Chelatococcus reniformis TaxID=1494448 RepID=A0A916UWU5_9HYPH|nr:amidase [Chelatococcus reniformis]GGC91106.1 amidase [Chelatococcus reniformis]